jgi:hypothetical protein
VGIGDSTAQGRPADTLVDRVVPALADWALLLTLGPDGEVVDAVGAHADEEHGAVLEELAAALPTGWRSGLRATALLDGQETRLLADLHRLRTPRVADLVGDACLADHLAQLRTRCVLVVAVPARGRRSARLGGLLLVARDLGSRPWTEHDVERVRDLVR